jgi:YihY family inner membrane protein
MSGTGAEPGDDRLRALAARVVERAGGLPAVRTLFATLALFDQAGGGLVAGGLAYTSLLALLPSLLLVISVVGVVVRDPVQREGIVSTIATALPPLENVARSSLEQVASGAVPTGIVAFVGLLWGSSRFYASLDKALSRVFPTARMRNEIERTLRGVAVTVLFVALPVAVLVAGSVASWLLDLAPAGVEVRGVGRALWQVGSPLGSLVLFVGGAAAVFRFVPAERIPGWALRTPAVVSGVALAAFTQVFTFVAPRLVGVAALYGTFVTVFAVLAWLSIGFNVLLLGACWTRVRLLARTPTPEVPA